jgi:protein-L-isoaspartate(D-aspartate) O-methyltransferase
MNTELARRQMVDQQIRTQAVTDGRVLDLFGSLSREDFVPPEFRRLAFADCAIPLGFGQFMMMPSVEARLIQALDLDTRDHVLEIGTGSGFLTACLARLAATVVSIDIYRDFVTAAAARLAQHDIDNVSISVMDACHELPDGPFNAIAVTGSLSTLDQRYIEALKPGGRLFIVTGDAPVMDAQLLVRGDDSSWRAKSLFETSLGRLQNAAEPTRFSF